MELLKIEVETFGGSPVAEHNYPCPVCRARHAVLEMDKGIFQPCWECQKLGWAVVQKKTRFWPWKW